MTDTSTAEIRLLPESAPTFREQQIAFWRNEARQNWTLGFMDLARLCEGFATQWEFDEVQPCAS